jgi:UDP-N-acetylmuramoylalanine--D-glutamate ligase
MQLNGKKVLVIGLGISGRAAVRFLLSRNAIVTAVDGNADVVKNNAEVAALRDSGALILLQDDLKSSETFDLVVVSPGVPPSHPLCVQANKKQITIIGEVELALREITIPCIGITGTNGKTTVTLLTTHILNSCGKKALALGNIGTPIADAVETLVQGKYDIAVVELSSFQLDTLHHRCLDVGVLLNITPDHLDRYETMEAYARSKANISSAIKSNGALIIDEECFKEHAKLFPQKNALLYGYSSDSFVHAKEKTVYVDSKAAFILPKTFHKERSHDIENIMAAFAICHRYGVTGEQFLRGLETFEKPHHRIEFIREFEGVRFYDDSKGTNIDAVVRAVESLQGRIILIAGGVDKGAPYVPWIAVFEGKVKSICAIGQASEKIQADMGKHFPVTTHGTLDEAVGHAFTQAKEGDCILLSPGCSSYDMFKDYVHRGKEFQRIVNSFGKKH